MTWTSLWLFIVPFAIAAALPGPAQGTMIATVVARGRASAVAFVAGMVMGNALWLVATLFGLASLALRYESAFVAVKWMGVAYLLFVAWKLWSATPVWEAESTGRPKGWLAGMLLTLGNPKAVVFFGAILPHAFDMSALSVTEALLIVALGATIDSVVQAGYLYAALRARRFIGKPAHLRLVNRTAAALIGGCALLVAKR